MGFSLIDRLQAAVRGFTVPGGAPTQPQDWTSLAKWDTTLGMGKSSAGAMVTTDTALQFPAFWSAVRLLSTTIAGLPFQVVERDGSIRRLASDHPLYPIIHREPNAYMTSFVYRQVVMMDMCLHGNAFVLIHTGEDMRPRTLEVLDPAEVRVFKYEGDLYYSVSGHEEAYPSTSIIHLRGLTADGIMGLSVVSYAREAIGSGLKAQEYSGELLSNGVTANGVIEMPGKMPTPEQLEDLKKQLGKQFSGKMTNSRGIAILYDGMKYSRIAIPPADAQFIEQKQFSVTDIARMFNLPPHLVGDLTRSTNNNIEQQSLEYVQYALMPWVKTIEQEHDRKLFREDERDRFGTKLNLDGLLRGDIATRTAYYQAAINSGWMTRDEARRLENMEALNDGLGDVPLVPVNLTTMNKLTKDEE